MKIAVVRVRGQVHVRHDIKAALKTFGLDKKNHCVVVEDSPSTQGMLAKVKYYTTWGPVNEQVLAALEKRGCKKAFRLNPPRKGFGRKGIKISFKMAGALGDRGEKINDLILRMV
ncbi:MAG TPA: uL30 family ribosomal protein [Candidatus Nanoarchaeia archaeon]|nr:uL30 family ribosomal protein [Candidatus Nanoarchaeia archaeon]